MQNIKNCIFTFTTEEIDKIIIKENKPLSRLEIVNKLIEICKNNSTRKHFDKNVIFDGQNVYIKVAFHIKKLEFIKKCRSVGLSPRRKKPIKYRRIPV